MNLNQTNCDHASIVDISLFIPMTEFLVHLVGYRSIFNILCSQLFIADYYDSDWEIFDNEIKIHQAQGMTRCRNIIKAQTNYRKITGDQRKRMRVRERERERKCTYMHLKQKIWSIKRPLTTSLFSSYPFIHEFIIYYTFYLFIYQPIYLYPSICL